MQFRLSSQPSWQLTRRHCAAFVIIDAAAAWETKSMSSEELSIGTVDRRATEAPGHRAGGEREGTVHGVVRLQPTLYRTSMSAARFRSGA